MFKWAILAALTVAVQAGTIVWNGSFNPFTTPSDFEKWSWANQVGTYQYYIHGSGAASKYLALDSSYKNPAHTSEQRGLKMTIDSTATWNSNMERIELIPQTTANLGTGQMYYHFSVKRTNTNAPDWTLEHQIMFFESHFTEIKYGVGNDNAKKQSLVWMIGGQEKWSTPFTADTWFNFAYDINFSAQTVGLWASTGSAPLQRVFNNAAASTSTNSADFHVGILRIVNTTPPEDWYVSGVYIESGSLTTSMGSGSGNTTTTTTVGGGTTTTTTTSTPTTTTATTTTTTGPTQTQWGQCGGTGYTGPTTCASPYTCKAVSPPFYYQCQ